MVREDGSLELYESEEEFNASLPGWAARERFGIDSEHLDGDELAALPTRPVARLWRRPSCLGWKTVSDPQHVGKALWDYAEQSWRRVSSRARSGS